MSGPFGSSQWMYNPSSSFYPYAIDQSLRFEDGDSPFLSRTPSGAGNRKTWTWSAWVKRANITSEQTLFGAHKGANDYVAIQFDANDTLNVTYKNVSASGGSLSSQTRRKITTQVFRDVSSFYHLVVKFDAANTNCDIYVNGTEVTSFSVNEEPQDLNFEVNSTELHTVGTFQTSVTGVAVTYFDGYMSQVNLIDGTALGPNSFGETKDGIWVPKDVSGLTYGTNGFHLDFADSSAIGNDVSGQNNDFTVSGGGSPTLVASDVVPDSPTNNFAVMNVLDKSSMTLSQGNLRPTPTGDYKGVRGNFAIPLTGKWFFEARVTTGGGGNITDSQIGIATDQNVLTGTSPYPQTATYAVLYFLSGTIRRLGSEVQTSLSSFAAGDVLGVAINSTDNEVQFYKNGSTVGSAVALPSTTKNSFAFFAGATSRSSVFNFGQDSTFAGAVSAGSATDGVGTFQSLPTDFKALCSANLPEPAIIDASDYFNTVLYTGNGGTQSITGVGFQPDWVWMKSRDEGSSSYTGHHVVQDSVRGVGTDTALVTNENYSEATAGYSDALTAFNSDGFTLGARNQVNYNTDAFVSWNWLAGTAVSGNTTGSGTAKAYSGSVNTKAGFSIITYKGNGTAGHTIPHNLTVGGVATAPTMVIFKNRDVNDQWAVYHKDILATHNLCLNNTDGNADQDNRFNDTEPTDSVMTLGTGHVVNATDEDYIAYFFTDIDQYCKAGVYSGKSSADGTYVHLGFRPAWLMVKSTSSGTQWMIYDNKRLGYNVDNNALTADDNATEKTDNDVDLLSNGFKWRRSSPNFNQSTYIYLAFAEQPAKYSNAR